jgi:Activator of Hsp90 ATPase homolog 1-like protein
MTGQDFTTAFTVDNTPEEVFAAINDVRGWWSQEVVGETTKLGDTFTFEVPGVHRTTQTLTEVIPGKKVVWHITDGWIGFVDDKSEWDDTDIAFDITAKDAQTVVRFTHTGLTPAVECYDVCSSAWSAYMLGSLRDLITTGKGDPHRAGGDFDSETDKHEATSKTATV